MMASSIDPAASKVTVTVTITETDEVDTPLATFLYSETPTASTRCEKGQRAVVNSRVDVLPPQLLAATGTSASKKTLPASSSTASVLMRSAVNYVIDVFLPAGYPQSVSSDYLEYQIYDSVQAFSSSIAGLLSSRAVLQGVGVGDAGASPTSALLLQILQDTSGRIATILFAHRLGTALEPECKMYRLAADVFNDIAMVLDCLSPLVTPRAARVAVISGAGVLRALCGVAAGSSKASLSAHFAKWGNIGELNAKDSSQETIISLLGMLAGSIVVSHVTSLPTTWICLIALLVIHLATNYRAVRAVQMTSLNRQRANIVFSTLFETDAEPWTNQTKESGAPTKRLKHDDVDDDIFPNLHVPRPNEVAAHERIFERDGILRWTCPTSPSPSSSKVGWCRIGTSLQDLISLLQRDNSLSILPKLTSLFTSESYLLFLFLPTSTSTSKRHGVHPRAIIVLKHACTPSQRLKAWAHALLAARILHRDDQGGTTEGILRVVEHSLTVLNAEARFDAYLARLRGAGWALDVAALETTPGRRIQIS